MLNCTSFAPLRQTDLKKDTCWSNQNLIQEHDVSVLVYLDLLVTEIWKKIIFTIIKISHKTGTSIASYRNIQRYSNICPWLPWQPTNKVARGMGRKSATNLMLYESNTSKPTQLDLITTSVKSTTTRFLDLETYLHRPWEMKLDELYGRLTIYTTPTST